MFMRVFSLFLQCVYFKVRARDCACMCILVIIIIIYHDTFFIFTYSRTVSSSSSSSFCVVVIIIILRDYDDASLLFIFYLASYALIFLYTFSMFLLPTLVSSQSTCARYSNSTKTYTHNLFIHKTYLFTIYRYTLKLQVYHKIKLKTLLFLNPFITNNFFFFFLLRFLFFSVNSRR